LFYDHVVSHSCHGTAAGRRVNGAACEAGAAAEGAASQKDSDDRFVFESIAVKILGVLNSAALSSVE